MPKKLEKRKKATIHSDLKDFDIKINSFGQMETNYSIDKLNQFLNEKTGKEEAKKIVKKDNDDIPIE
jgi:Rps23 Pro-64 3,4-dihydroxylase Tpa1-like proline 4-hydroxylase